MVNENSQLGKELSPLIELYHGVKVYDLAVHKKVKAELLKDYQAGEQIDKGFRLPRFSGLVHTSVEQILSDFDRYSSLEYGRAFRRTVKNLRDLFPDEKKEQAEQLQGNLRDHLRKSLYGNGTPFPELLASLWDIKMLGEDIYRNSLNAAKWGAAIACGINGYNIGHDIDFRLNPEKLFIAVFLHDYGMLHRNIIWLCDSSGKFSPAEKELLNGHSKLGLDMLIEMGIPKLDYLVEAVGYHISPIDIISGITKVAEEFEGTAFSRSYREGRLSWEEVFKMLGDDLFTKEDLESIEESDEESDEEFSSRRYEYDAEDIQKNPLKPPYQILRRLIMTKMLSR